MENKKEIETLASGFKKMEDNEITILIALALITGLFSDWGYSGKKPESDTETRLAKLEAKTDLLEKIILK